MKINRNLAALLLLLVATPAQAHLDPAAHGSFAAGFTHPVFGLDHVLAMIAVGLWAALQGGRAIWSLPSAFVLAMIGGFLLKMAGVHLPMVEPLILASVVALGALVALSAKLPSALAILIVGGFGLFHGHAHGSEIGSAGEFGYAFGFIAATALLHAAGVLIGYGAKTSLGSNGKRGEMATRFLGGVTALCGLALFAA